jgi:hypothetical protein
MDRNFNEGDIHSNKRGTCARANNGKIRLSLFPMHLIAGATRVLMWGATKYVEWNWAKGGRWSTAFDCMMRHMFKWWFFREEFDKESGMHHLDHALCNLMFLLHFKDTYKEGDDRPPIDTTGFCESLTNFNIQWKPEPIQTDEELHRLFDNKKRQSVTMGMDINKTIRVNNTICKGCKIPKLGGNCSEYCPYNAKNELTEYMI